MIPKTAIQAAAAKLLNHTPPHWCPRCQGEDPFCPWCDRDAYELMEAALEAALPHLEAVLRKQIAEEEQQAFSQAARRRSAEVITARIVEEGAFHCCAHPKCPGGSICCCQDAEEGNTK